MGALYARILPTIERSLTDGASFFYYFDRRRRMGSAEPSQFGQAPLILRRRDPSARMRRVQCGHLRQQRVSLGVRHLGGFTPRRIVDVREFSCRGDNPRPGQDGIPWRGRKCPGSLRSGGRWRWERCGCIVVRGLRRALVNGVSPRATGYRHCGNRQRGQASAITSKWRHECLSSIPGLQSVSPVRPSRSMSCGLRYVIKDP